MADIDVDKLIAASILEAQIEFGGTAEWAAKNAPEIMHLVKPGVRGKTWTPAEVDFLATNLYRIGFEAAAAHLGRSPYGVRIFVRRTKNRINGPARDPRNLTAEKVGNMLGIDPKIVHRWDTIGILKFQRLTQLGMVRTITSEDFAAWVLDTDNWVYFQIEKVLHAPLRDMLSQKREEWGDDWLTARQAADILGITTHELADQGNKGRIPFRKVSQQVNPSWVPRHYLLSDVTNPEIAAVIHSRVGLLKRKKGESYDHTNHHNQPV